MEKSSWYQHNESTRKNRWKQNQKDRHAFTYCAFKAAFKKGGLQYSKSNRLKRYALSKTVSCDVEHRFPIWLLVCCLQLQQSNLDMKPAIRYLHYLFKVRFFWHKDVFPNCIHCKSIYIYIYVYMYMYMYTIIHPWLYLVNEDVSIIDKFSAVLTDRGTASPKSPCRPRSLLRWSLPGTSV